MALRCRGAVTAPRSARAHSSHSTPRVATAMSRRAAAAAHCPAATSAGTAHAAPIGVHPSTPAICGMRSRTPAVEVRASVPVTMGPAMISRTSTIVPMNSRPRRFPPTPRESADTSRDATTHVSTARATHTSAVPAASGHRNQSASVASAAIDVAMPGMPVRPVAVRASMICRVLSGNGASLSASTVVSMPVTSTGPSTQPSSSADPPMMATARAPSRLWNTATATRPATTDVRMPSAQRMPKQKPTSCQGRRARVLPRMRYLSLRTVATTAVPPTCGDLPRARGSGPAGSHPRAPRRPFRRPGRDRPR